MTGTAEPEVRVADNVTLGRYEITLDGRIVGVADYSVVEGRMVLPHTEIEPAMRGRGLAEVLVRHVLDDARVRGLTVVPTCWYVAQYIDHHSEYADLLDR